MKSKRITLQLTPLLDLMLVVIFAQYLQLNVVVDRKVEAAGLEAQARIESMENEVREAEKRRNDAEIMRSQAVAELEARSGTLGEARQEIAALRARIKQYEVGLVEERRQHRADLEKLGETAAELFDIDAGLFEEAVSGLSPEAARKLRDDFADLKGASSEAIIRHLREIDEIKKRIDTWEVHVNAEGRTSLRMPGLDEPALFWVSDNESFLIRARKEIQNLAEPKSLVLILFSFGDATWQARKPVEEGVLLLQEWLKKEFSGKTFHVAQLGYTLSEP